MPTAVNTVRLLMMDSKCVRKIQSSLPNKAEKQCILLGFSKVPVFLCHSVPMAVNTVLRLLMMDSKSLRNIQSSLPNKAEKQCMSLAYIIRRNANVTADYNSNWSESKSLSQLAAFVPLHCSQVSVILGTNLMLYDRNN